MVKQCKCKSMGGFNPKCPVAKRQELARYKADLKAKQLLITTEQRYRDMLV